MNLITDRPIAFFDLETTGINIATDRIVEISILKISPTGERTSYTQRVNPGIPIPLEVSEIHGIYDIDVQNEPMFEEVADKVFKMIFECDLAGFNSDRFDIPLLAEEFMRAEIEFNAEGRRTIDVQTIFHKMEPRNLSAAYKFYCNRNLENAHSAEADTIATYEILEAQIERYDIGADISSLAELTDRGHNNVDFAGRIARNDQNVEVFNFGKHKGRAVEEVFRQEPGYYNWMMKSDFPLYTKKVLKEIKERIEA